MSSDEFVPDPPIDIPIPAITDEPSDSDQPFDQAEEESKATFVMEVVLPHFLDASLSLLEGHPDAQAKAAMLVDSLKQNATAAQEGEDGFWTAAAAVCHAVLIDRESAMQLVKRTDVLDKRPGFSWKTLCVMCYIGGSVDPHALPRMAVMLHMAIAEYVYRHTSHNVPLYEQVIVPWFARYWERTFENARFRFYAPQIVAMDMRDALKSAPAIRVQRVLRAASFGLWEPLPEKGRSWFELTDSVTT